MKEVGLPEEYLSSPLSKQSQVEIFCTTQIVKRIAKDIFNLQIQFHSKNLSNEQN